MYASNTRPHNRAVAPDVPARAARFGARHSHSMARLPALGSGAPSTSASSRGRMYICASAATAPARAGKRLQFPFTRIVGQVRNGISPVPGVASPRESARYG